MSREIRNQWATQPINTLRLKVTGQWGEAIALTVGNVQQLKEPINFQPPREVNTGVPAEDVGRLGMGQPLVQAQRVPWWLRRFNAPPKCHNPRSPEVRKRSRKDGIIYNYRKCPEDVNDKHFEFTGKAEAECWRKSPSAPLNETIDSSYYLNMLAGWWFIDVHDNIWKKVLTSKETKLHFETDNQF